MIYNISGAFHQIVFCIFHETMFRQVITYYSNRFAPTKTKQSIKSYPKLIQSIRHKVGKQASGRVAF